ncbi:sialate O-acetylesterase-like [Haliotis asinina]|uniref:sialate O-acetylesterase-like n=1 Tax=Haliotis asinina TaxID=109174 RepID=UPI003531FD99
MIRRYLTTGERTGLSTNLGPMAFLQCMFLSLLLRAAAYSVDERGDEIYAMFQNGFPNKVTPQKSPSNFTFASYYGNHMVLQRAPKQAIIWGYSPNIGEVIKVKVEGQETISGRVYNDSIYGVGIWKVTLPPMSQPGPFTITASSATETITLTDVLFGDVWICSGQSNMQFTVNRMFNATAEIAAATNFTNIRLFSVALKFNPTETLDLLAVNEGWSLPSKKSLVDHTGSVYFSAVCWLYGRLMYQEFAYPIGLIDTSYGGTPIEAWSSRDALAQCGISPTDIVDSYVYEIEKTLPGYTNSHTPTQLWNCMIHPLLNMTIYGVIWYQGENNAIPHSNTHKYNCTFPAMISDWRLKFNQGSLGQTDKLFPFGFVQLGPKDPKPSVQSGYAEIRWHQTADYGYVPNPKMKKTFMAVAMDLADFGSPYGSVHIRDKPDVARRLYLSGLRVAYGKEVLAAGPLPTIVVENTTQLILTYQEKILYRNLEGFEVLCSVPGTHNTIWTPTPILSALPTSITLYSLVCGEGQTILGLRYSWRESPCAFKTCTVYSADNPLLPGPPFLVYHKMTGVAGTVHVIDWNTPTAIH